MFDWTLFLYVSIRDGVPRDGSGSSRVPPVWGEEFLPLLIEPSNRAILKEMLPPLPSVDSVFVSVSSSAEESSCVEEQRYLFVSLRSKTN